MCPAPGQPAALSRIPAERQPHSAQVIVGLTIFLTACGGGGLPEDASQQSSSAQPAVAARVDAAALSLESSAGNESAFHGCMRRLNVALRSDAARKDIDVACLAGTYVGRTRQGEACALRIVANTGHQRLVRAGNAIELELALLRPSVPQPSALDVQWADVEVGHLGMQFRSGGASRAGALETVVLTSGPRGADKVPTLDDLTYERTAAGNVQIVRCQFDS